MTCPGRPAAVYQRESKAVTRIVSQKGKHLMIKTARRLVQSYGHVVTVWRVGLFLVRVHLYFYSYVRMAMHAIIGGEP